MIAMGTQAITECRSEFRSETCPDCGAPVQVLYRLRENGHLFVWFECTQDTCRGQLLRKFPAAVPMQA